MRFLNAIWARIARMPKRYSVGGAAVLVVLAIIGFHYATRGSSATDAPSNISHVRISSVADMSSQTGPLPVTGKVSSVDEATILAQTAGEVTTLNRSLGDHVAAGEVIASFENSSQRAAVLQAQGSYDAAQAALGKLTGSTAQNSTITSQQAASAAQAAQVSANASLQSAYAAMDDAVHVRGDAMFSNARTNTPVFYLTIPDSQLATNLVNERAQLEGVLSKAGGIANNAPSVDVDTRISGMVADAQQTLNFISDLVTAANEAQPNLNVSATTIAADQTSLATARTEVVGAISSLTTAKTSYDSAQSGAATAANSAGAGTNSDVAAAQANVKQALGSLDAAQANLEKTIVRSPISGTIVSLPITQGDYVSSFSQVAVVSNPGALQVLSYVTPDDAKTLAVGGKADVEGGAAGTVVSIAPAIDPTTGKIQVKIGVTGGESALTDGELVTVTLARAAGSNTETAAAQKPITIPIVAAKVTPTGPIVFTVENGVLVAHAVTFGQVLGDQVTVVSGLTPDMVIVTDARGLSEGQSVIVDSQ